MLSLGKFPVQLQHSTAVFHNPKSQNPHVPSKPHVSFSAYRLNPFDSLAFPGKKSSGFCSNALKTKNKGGFAVSEMEGVEVFEDGFDDDDFLDIEDDGEFERDESEDDDGVIVPLQNMKEWLENRPRGFGIGKVYDTSVEDELMEEIEQSRKVQLANVNKLKSNPMKANSKKELDKASLHIPNGFRVRMVNLPKKMNIHKDLRLALEVVSGIQNIEPVVSGNEKTRDPVCKGLAFIDFKYKDQAERFVEDFSGTSLSFGKVQKQIKCELLNSKPQPASNQPKPKFKKPASDQLKPKSQKPASDQSHKKANRPPKQAVLISENVFQAIVDTNISFLSSGEEDVSSENDDADESYVVARWEDDEEITPKFSAELETRQESVVKSVPSKQGRKIKQNDKKGAPDMRKNKIPNLNIPGSAKRLKMREKSVLTGVFSKYGAKASSTVKEQSR